MYKRQEYDYPKDPNYQYDTDGDGIPNKDDPDDDNDGLEDAIDPLPLDPNNKPDTDGDGLNDGIDTRIRIRKFILKKLIPHLNIAQLGLIEEVVQRQLLEFQVSQTFIISGQLGEVSGKQKMVDKRMRIFLMVILEEVLVL